MARRPAPPADDDGAAPAAFRAQVAARYWVRLHVMLILTACFAVGLAVTKLLLMAGVSTLWLRYAVALVMAYLAFLLGVRLWLLYTGYDRRIMPGRRSSVADGADLPSFGGGGGGSGGSSVELPGFRGGGGGSGGGGASASFGGGSASPSTQALAFSSAESSAPAHASSGSHGSGSSSGGGLDLGDGDGFVLILLVLLVVAVAGGVAWIIYAAPTILADAAFAGMLSAGLVRSTRHIASGGWVASVVGHTWIAFAIVFVLAMVFAVVAQRHFPEARTLLDVVRSL